LQAKRQELSSIQDTEHSLKDEIVSLQRENSMVATAVETKRAKQKMAQNGLEQKKEQVGMLMKMLENTKGKLANEQLDTTSREQISETIEKTLENREKELQQVERNISSLKNKMYKDSQRLADLRKHESDFIADIHGAQGSIKHFLSKVNKLEIERVRRQELLYNANFQLQQLEKKVAHGLGERSNEVQQKLQSQIVVLEAELDTEKQKKLLLIQQQRRLQAELRAWNRKYEASDSKYNETMERIDDIGLEIFACGQSLKKMIARKEEAMVSHDVTLLDVRRLRDSLRNLLEAVCSLKQQATESS
jgi:chromosome segregation ATPase